MTVSSIDVNKPDDDYDGPALCSRSFSDSLLSHPLPLPGEEGRKKKRER